MYLDISLQLKKILFILLEPRCFVCWRSEELFPFENLANKKYFLNNI